MPKDQTADFLTGVIEGFYGQPWTREERLELFDWMSGWGLNTYFYAPKDDLKQRSIWREPYSNSEQEPLLEAIHACKQRKLHFIYGLSPGLDIRYGSNADVDCLKRRFQQMLDLGCDHFCLLFDDIPDCMDPEDIKQWGSLASAQCHLTNVMSQWARQRSVGARFLFCPTAYCGRMAERKHGGEGYLPTVGHELAPDIDVFWTGPEIISREIPLDHIREVGTVLRRKPLIWDNLHANDYDGRRFYCGPYAGRPPALRNEVSGLLINPNNEFPLNYVPIRTLSQFVRCEGMWDSRKAYLAAMKEWLVCFETVGQPVTLDDLVLFGDCYYLPHEEGAEAERLYEGARKLVAQKVPGAAELKEFRASAMRLREFCVRMTDLRHRPLFYALSRRIWELREELDLILGYLEKAGISYSSDFHLPDTYRGGMVARLQRLLTLQPDGTIAPACRTSTSATQRGSVTRSGGLDHGRRLEQPRHYE